jgi:hypothetical protein
MQVKTILNRIQKQRGFVYGDVRLADQLDGLALTVDLYPQCAESAAVRRLWAPGAPVRPPGAPSLRVRAALGPARLLPVHDAARRGRAGLSHQLGPGVSLGGVAVAWGRDHVDLTGIRAIGIDEIHWQHGPRFLTLVYPTDAIKEGIRIWPK